MNQSRIKISQLGVLKDCVAILGKPESGSILQLLNGKSDNWWWKSVSKLEITPDYYAVVLFVSHINFQQNISLKLYQSMVFAKQNGLKAPISATICGVMIGNIVFVNELCDGEYKFDFSLNTEDGVMLKSIGSTSNDVSFRGIFNIKNCPFYCPVSF